MANMATGLSTHILRLADIYLIYAEAVLGNKPSTTEAKALEVFNRVRARAFGKSYEEFLETTDYVNSLTFDVIWKERRLELATEGDRWYDYVRLHYYNPSRAISEIKAQRRSTYEGLKEYYASGSLDSEVTYYNENTPVPNVNDSHFKLPFPDTDLTMNKHLLEEAVDHDVSQYGY